MDEQRTTDELKSTYEMCKILIIKKRYVKDEMLQNLDIFLLGKRITKEQYEELIELIDSQSQIKETV